MAALRCGPPFPVKRIESALGRKLLPGETLAVYVQDQRRVWFWRIGADGRPEKDPIRFYDKRREPVLCREYNIRVGCYRDGTIRLHGAVHEIQPVPTRVWRNNPRSK